MKCFTKVNTVQQNKGYFWNQHQNLHQIHKTSDNIITYKFVTCCKTKKMQVTSLLLSCDRVGLGLDFFTCDNTFIDIILCKFLC